MCDKSKHAFVEELTFTSKKNADSAWRPNNKNIYKVPGNSKNSAKQRDALIKLLQGMREEQTPTLLLKSK